MPVTSLRDSYSATAAAWGREPMHIYGKLATELLARAPVPLAGQRVLDLGCGTGAASLPATAAGARVVGVDIALGMLLAGRTVRPPGAAGDALALPFPAAVFDTVVAAFCLNHFPAPAVAVREAARVLQPAGHLLASTFARQDEHPVRDAVDHALAERGWTAPAWYAGVRAAMASWGTKSAAAAVIEQGGMRAVQVEQGDVEFPDLDARALVRWRLDMPSAAPFVASLDRQERARLEDRALALIGDAPPLVRTVIFIVARAH